MGGMDFGSTPAQTRKAWFAPPLQGGGFLWRGHETQGFTRGYPMAGFQPLGSWQERIWWRFAAKGGPCHHGSDGDARCPWGKESNLPAGCDH